MNPLIEIPLVLAIFAAFVALSYAMRWWHDRHPVVEVMPSPPALERGEPAPDPFASPVIVGAPPFYDGIGSDGEQEEY